MPCRYDETPQEQQDRFNRDALFNSPATVLLCEAMTLIESAGLTGKCSADLLAWWRQHEADDKERLAREMAEANTKAERDAAIAKLTPRERKMLRL
jgi:hypothetical protein